MKRQISIISAIVLLCFSSIRAQDASQIQLGMRTESVLAILGQPSRINHTLTPNGTTDIWYYDYTDRSIIIIVIENGWVESVTE